MKRQIIIRSLTLFLTFATLFTCFVPVTAAPVKLPENYEKQVVALKQLGLIYDADSFINQPESTITRADVAYAAGNLVSDSPTGFTELSDVSESHWAYGQIQYVVTAKIMNPLSATMFAAGEKITNSETANVFARTIWNSVLSSMETDNGKTFIENTAGNILGSATFDADTTRSQFVSTLLYVINQKAANLDSVGIAGGSDEYHIEVSRDETLLSKYRNIDKIIGVVTANEKTSLLSPTGSEKNTVRIDDVSYDIGKTNISDYLGYNVIAYVKTDDNGEKTICSFYENDNYVIEIDDDDIYKTSRYSISYFEEGKTRATTVNLTKFTDIIYNGIMTSEITAEDFKVNNGKLILIDNDDDGDIDAVFIESYEDIVVKNADWNNDKIYDELSGKVLDVNEKKAEVSYFLGDLVLTREEAEKYIAAEDTLSVLTSKAAGGKQYITIYVCFDKDTGVISEMQSDDTYIKIGEKEYKIGYVAKKNNLLKKFKVGDTVKYYLNYAGEIVYLKISTESGLCPPRKNRQ